MFAAISGWGSALLFGIATDPPPVPAYFDGKRLLEMCVGDPPSWRCSMYVAGVVDAMLLQEAERPRGTLRARSGLTNLQAGRLVRDFLAENTQYWQLAASRAVRRAILPKLPCEAS
jgi:hypothetical protein